ncbi:MAG: hypothetical protein GY874_13530 [Desulfobacteraceae bacterium]|nr:hypothetical protein [Desulfobacteraceae bacterium]
MLFRLSHQLGVYFDTSCTHIFLFLSFLFSYLHHSHRGKPNCVQSLLSIFSIGLSAMMCCLGVFGIMEVKELAEIFVSVYMILFSVLLFLYELLWWSGRLPCCDAAKVNKHLRTNFGFMYGVRGRGAYLVFVAFVVLGLQNDVSVGFLRYLTGGCFLGTGICMLLLHFWKPHILGTYNAPTAGLGDDDINMPV